MHAGEGGHGMRMKASSGHQKVANALYPTIKAAIDAARTVV